MESKRERVKDEIFDWMKSEFHREREEVYERVCDLTDAIFDTLDIDPDEQDCP
jgi:hypothetical protein